MLADELAKMPCIILHPESTACDSSSPRLVILPSYLTIVARLLDGREDEVTTTVRRKTYFLLAKTLNHHDPVSIEGLDHIYAMVVRGLVDQDRSVRLSAG